MSSANSHIPDLTIWASIQDSATPALGKLAARIASDIASDKALAGLQKTGSIRLAMQFRAESWMAQAYGCCLKCWKEGGNKQETPEFRLSIVFYALSPFYMKEMLRLLRLAAGVSLETLTRLEIGRSSLQTDSSALGDASAVWGSMLETWHTALPPIVSASNSDAIGSLGESKAKPAEVPTNFPAEFPPTLKLKMHVIVSRCVKALPDRSSLDHLCTEIVSQSTELFCTAVRQGILKAYAVPDHLNEVLHYVRVANCDNNNERYRVEKFVANSDEWLSMLTRLAECEESQAPADKPLPETKTATDRKQKIQAFIAALQKSGVSISKKDIWRAAGYGDATEFERFQRADERTTNASEGNFTRVLNMSPEAFIVLLKKLDSR